MQTKNMPRYANPTGDMPKGMFDLMAKISTNQGLLAFWRGQSPLVFILAAQHSFKFILYDSL